MSDFFENFSPDLSSPVGNHFAVTPSDTVDLAVRPRALYIGTPGDIKITDGAGVSVTYVYASGILPIRAMRVWATGTTASDIVGIY